MVNTPIKNLNDKDPVQDRIFLVKDKILGVGKTGKTFLTVLIGDQSGQLDGRIWDNIEEVSSRFDIGDLIKIKGVVQIYNQRKQLIIHRLDKVDDATINKDDYKIRERQIDTYSLFAELSQMVKEIEIAPLKQLLQDCLQDEDIKARMLRAPAAKTIHHAHRGGLLEHVVSICKVMQFMASHYSYLNKDLLIFGAIFHDLGKIWELDQTEQQQIYYTNQGQLLGHMLLACELVEKKSQKILGFPDDLRTVLKHIILAHHGKLEYGSPKVPMFPEALVVAMIDDMDSKMDTMMSFINQERQSGESWSRYNENFERYFYLDDLKTKWNGK
ncbi:HD family phosphohydrolase [Bdellovibrio sp. qaytius]|nr:HD family phosphohydrolase [Bdellovibrio sp. qaytius]